MSLRAYEDACNRAELFDLPKPDKEEFLAKNKHLDVETENQDFSAESTAMLGEDLKAVGGGFTELNTILDSTQTKLNRLKGVCGSITNFFRAKLVTKDGLSYSSEPSYVGQTTADGTITTKPHQVGSSNTGLSVCDDEKIKMAGQDGRLDINSGLKDLQAMQATENTALLSKATAKDMKMQIDSQVSKLDQLISQADRAQSSMQHQNKQMRSYLK